MLGVFFDSRYWPLVVRRLTFGLLGCERGRYLEDTHCRSALEKGQNYSQGSRDANSNLKKGMKLLTHVG